ncbi:MAG: hypothetical protein ACJ787_17635, partial [Myxococcales bacterium]
PAAIRRYVYGRDGGRCTFVDGRGHRCKETGFLEFDHLDGFARTHLHDPERIVLRCRAHNQHEAEKMYGREFMAAARAKRSLRPQLRSRYLHREGAGTPLTTGHRGHCVARRDPSQGLS